MVLIDTHPMCILYLHQRIAEKVFKRRELRTVEDRLFGRVQRKHTARTKETVSICFRRAYEIVGAHPGKLSAACCHQGMARVASLVVQLIFLESL